MTAEAIVNADPGTTVNVSLGLTNGGAGDGTATLKLKVVESDPSDRENVEIGPDNDETTHAVRLNAGGAYLSYIQSRGDVDFFEVRGPDGTSLPYGTKVMASLSALPAGTDFDIALFEDDLSTGGDEEMQKLSYIGSPSLTSSLLDAHYVPGTPLDIRYVPGTPLRHSVRPGDPLRHPLRARHSHRRHSLRARHPV